MELIQRLNLEQGITVLMVTHEADIAAYAGRIVRFVDGRIESDRLNPDRVGLKPVRADAAATEAH